MLATLSTLPRDERAYTCEYKWDGVRAIAYCEGGNLRLESRNLLEITPRYPELWRLGSALPRRRVILDGEIVALDEQGRPSFSLLQQRMHVAETRGTPRAVPIVYMVFDLLYLDGRSLMDRPYKDRRAALEVLELSAGHWQTPPAYPGIGRRLLAAAQQCGLEGIVAKKTDSTYQPGRRSRDWLKVKVVQRQEFVVGGWAPGEGTHRGMIGSLAVGYYEPARGGERRLHYAGNVGTGFTQEDQKQLRPILDRLRRDTSPFAERLPRRDLKFIEPSLVAEVEFREWTHGGILRHPSYKGLRMDKKAAEVIRERPG